MNYSLFKENTTNDSQTRKRKKKKASKPRFIEYNQDQQILLPPSLEELIPEKHIVRTVNKVIEAMNIEALIKTYKGGGRSAYNPIMLLKVLIYAYIMRIYSSRRISKALREDITFMWLSGNQKPDFRTLNNFRSGRLKGVIEEVFSSMIIFLTENKYIRLENYFVDGTKIEANANRYSYVWSKNTQRYKASTKEKIKQIIKQIEEVNKEENKKYGDKDLEELGEDAQQISSDKIEKQVEKLNNIISQISESSQQEQKDNKKDQRDKIRELNKAVNQLSKKYLPKLKKYEQQEKILGQRNSYSKTDKDATFFVNKEKQSRPSYNLIIGTEQQIIVNYSLHQKSSESDKFIAHINKLKRISNHNKPQRVIGDGAYGSEENYDFLNREGIESYLKYSGFYQQEINKKEKNRFDRTNFIYNRQEDSIYCPEGRRMSIESIEEKITENGYKQQKKIYRGDCQGCQYLKLCSKTPKGRTIQINKKWEKYKLKTKENLTSPLGQELRKRRNVDVESVFGDIKHNQGFRRFNLRGLEKVNTEFGLVAIAHNIKKLTAMIN